MRALLLFSAAVAGTQAIVMAAFLLSHRGHKGFAQWTVATALGAASLAFFALRGLVPALVSIVGVDLSLLAMAPLFLDGTRRFLGAGHSSRAWYATSATALAVCLFFTLGRDEIGIRTAVLMAATAAPLAATSLLVARHHLAERSLLHTWLATEFGLSAAIIFARGVWVWRQTGFSLLDEAPLQVAFFATAVVLNLGITATLVLLTTDRAAAELAAARAELTARVGDLEQAIAEVRTLEGLLPVCAACKRIRDEQGEWIQMEVYVRDRTRATFSHGLCPECLPKYFPVATGNRAGTSRT